MKSFLFYIVLFLTNACFNSHLLPKRCKEFSEHYQKALDTAISLEINSLEDFHSYHKSFVKRIIKEWPQTEENQEKFSSSVYAQLNSQVIFQCGSENSHSSREYKKTIDDRGLKKVEKIQSPYFKCLTHLWLLHAKNFVLKSCKAYFKQ